jgi:hypothetical protein
LESPDQTPKEVPAPGVKVRVFEAGGKNHLVSQLSADDGLPLRITDLQGREMVEGPPYRIGYVWVGA